MERTEYKYGTKVQTHYLTAKANLLETYPYYKRDSNLEEGYTERTRTSTVFTCDIDDACKMTRDAAQWTAEKLKELFPEEEFTVVRVSVSTEVWIEATEINKTE